jgi:hypothetical protein
MYILLRFETLMMRLALLWYVTIVAAFPPQASAATPPIARVPVTRSVGAVAERLGMDVDRDRARFTSEIIRRLYSPPASRRIALDLSVSPRATAESSVALVDVPLTPEIWSAAIFRRPISSDHLLASILLDRRAALLCRALGAADDDTLAFYAEHPALLAFIYERAPGTFAAFANSLRVRDGHLVVPGGAPAERLWQSVAHVSTSDADGFIRALLFDPEARLTYLYSAIAEASAHARDFALGLWIEDEALRVRRFEALAMTVRSLYREWHIEELPFARPLNDLAVMLFRIRTRERGAPAPPAQRRFWAAVLGANPSLDAASETAAASHTLVDAAWLLGATAGDMYSRGDRLEQFAFGQRVFGGRPDADSEVTAGVLREMLTRRMLLLSLERIGVTDPEVYAAAQRQARATLDSGDAERFWTVAGQQGAMAMVVRMSTVGSITRNDAQALLKSMFALPLSGGEFKGALAGWFESTLAPHLPDGSTWQSRAIAGLAGGATPGSTRIEWEGQTYRLDLAYAERRRIEEVRDRQGGPDLDVALALARLARAAGQATTADAARPLLEDLDNLLSASGALLARPQSVQMANGVPLPRDGREWLQRTAEELDRGVRANDPKRIARAAEALTTIGDTTLGHALLSLVYAVHLGDPDGPALLGANVALRHDFGFGRRDGEGRSRGPWAQPRQDFQPGVPWHVVGSLVGLDIALAPLSLHRLSMDGLAAPPRLQSIEREAFAINAAVLDARRLSDTERDEVVAGIAKGRARVKALAADPAEFEKLEAELALDGWRVRAIRWVLQNAPASIDNQFSLSELLRLGSPGRAFDTWGASGLLTFGCICVRFPEPYTWRIFAGRTQLAMMAASTVEMNLEMAQRLASLQLPAALLPSVLATAMQDFTDQAEPADPNDLPALADYPRRITDSLMDDYIAATATLDGPLVSADLDVSEP